MLKEKAGEIAGKIWNYLFTHQNQIMALKQARFDF